MLLIILCQTPGLHSDLRLASVWSHEERKWRQIKLLYNSGVAKECLSYEFTGVTSPCDRINVVRDLYGNAFSCRTEGCPRGTCLAAIAEDVGVCCQRPETTTEMPAHLRARSSELPVKLFSLFKQAESSETKSVMALVFSSLQIAHSTVTQ